MASSQNKNVSSTSLNQFSKGTMDLGNAFKAHFDQSDGTIPPHNQYFH
jgi:hypothetical protein